MIECSHKEYKDDISSILIRCFEGKKAISVLHRISVSIFRGFCTMKYKTALKAAILPTAASREKKASDG